MTNRDDIEDPITLLEVAGELGRLLGMIGAIALIGACIKVGFGL